MRLTQSSLARSFGRPCRSGSGAVPALRPGFTLTELLVVIAIIALVLAVAVPGLSGMTRDARINSAIATTTGVISRAYIMSQADARMIAVRAVPAEWDRTYDPNSPRPTIGRQHLAIFNYVGATERAVWGPSGLDAQIDFQERFERRRDVEAVELPTNVWLAPLEAWRYAAYTGSSNDEVRHPLNGDIGRFELDAAAPNNRFLDADDFLIIFDPQSGLRLPTWSREAGQVVRSTFTLKAFDPGDPSRPNRKFPGERDAERSQRGDVVGNNWFLRHNSGGLVFYDREQFIALGERARASDREALLRRIGRPYVVQRFGGGLSAGTP